MEYRIKNLEELNIWVQDFLTRLTQKDQANILTLKGEVGAGKTTLTQHLAKLLGITETVTSPTFVIQKEYKINNHAWIKKLIHIDAYRLERKEDLEYLGWNEIIQEQGNLVIIEWPEMVEGITLPEHVSLHLEINNDHSRTITKTIL